MKACRSPRPPVLRARSLLIGIGMLAGLCCSAVFGGAIRLRDGSVLQGAIESESDSVVIVRTETLGRLHLPPESLSSHDSKGSQDDVDRFREPVRGDRRRNLDPAGHALFFLPTAFVPPRGASTFRDFELFFLAFGHSITDATVISGGFLFPVTADVQLLTGGFKHQLWRSHDSRTAIALTGNLTVPLIAEMEEDVYLVSSNAIFSRRIRSGGFPDGIGLHAGVGYAGASYEDEYYGEPLRVWQDNFSWGFGVESRMTENSKIMAEFLSATPFDLDDANVGLLTLGVRLHGSRLSADIAGFRPLMENEGGTFILWPLLTIGYLF